jgi:hypothetical protein
MAEMSIIDWAHPVAKAGSLHDVALASNAFVVQPTQLEDGTILYGAIFGLGSDVPEHPEGSGDRRRDFRSLPVRNCLFCFILNKQYP